MRAVPNYSTIKELMVSQMTLAQIQELFPKKYNSLVGNFFTLINEESIGDPLVVYFSLN